MRGVCRALEVVRRTVVDEPPAHLLNLAELEARARASKALAHWTCDGLMAPQRASIPAAGAGIPR